MTRPRLVTAADAAPRLVIAAAVDGVDPDARTLTGLIVPFGKAGNTSGGRLQFTNGSLTWADPKRVKLLREHDQRDVVGYATTIEATDAGYVATFHVPEGENGDRALAEAANGLRDAFSVGVQLDDATATRMRRSQGAAVEAAGALRETSLVSVPAFDDARLAAAGAGSLIVSSWAPVTAPTTTAGAAGTNESETGMTPEQIARLAALRAQDTLTQAEATELSTLGAMEADQTADGGAPTATAGTQQLATATAGPAVVPAVAGAAVVTAEASTYSFSDHDSHSLVSDLLRSALRGDGEAGERVAAFNAQLNGGNVNSILALVQAAATTTDVDGAGTDLPSVWQGNPNRPDLMRRFVDAKRPIVSRLDRIPITNAQPFSIPKVGKYEGVGDHTEGTPHRPAGTLTLSGDTMTPKAVSGAYECSRELIDQSNPVIDRIAVREMFKDYQGQTEAKAVALIRARAAQAGAIVAGIATPLALRGALIDFVNDDDEAADLVVVGKAMFKAFGLDVDGNDRPQLPFIQPVNAQGTMRAGYTGYAIDGNEIVRSARLDGGVGAGAGFMARKDGILWTESAVQQFRFDEVLGPGVVKLALWAYNGAAILDTADVKVLSTGAGATEAAATDSDPNT